MPLSKPWCETVSMRTVCPERIVRTGGRPAGRWPQTTVAEVEGTCASTRYEAGNIDEQLKQANAGMTQMRRRSFMDPGEGPIIASRNRGVTAGRAGAWSLARRRGRDLLDQILCLDRLHQKVLRALAHSPDAVGFLVPAGADDARNVLGCFVLRDCPRRLVAVDAGHDDIHQDHVGLLALG